MAQTWNEALAETTALATDRTTLNNNFAAARSNFSGSAAPTSPAPVKGQWWVDTTNNLVFMYDGAAWVQVGKLGTPADTQDVVVLIDNLAATGNFFLYVAPRNMTVVSFRLVSTVGTTSSAGNLWTVQIRNVTAAVDLRAVAYSTLSDSELVANVQEVVPPNQNQNIAAGDVIQAQLTKTGAPGDPGRTLLTMELKMR